MYIKFLTRQTVIMNAVHHPSQEWECVSMMSADIDTLRDVWL